MRKTLSKLKITGFRASARLFKRIGQDDISLSFYKESLLKDRSSKHPGSRYRYAFLLHKKGDYKNALLQINLAIKGSRVLKPKYLLLRAEIQMKLGNYVESEKDLRQAIEIDPKSKSLHYVLGVLFAIQGKWYQAEESLLAAKDLGFDSPKFNFRLAQASFEMGRFETAGNYYKKAARLWSKELEDFKHKAELLYLAGLSFEKAGKQSKADKLYNEAVLSDGHLDAEKYGVSVFHIERGLFDEALRELTREHTQDAYETSDILFKKGYVFYKLGDYDSAAKYIEKSLKYDYQEWYRHKLLGDIYKHLSKPVLAANSYENAFFRKNEHDANLCNEYASSLLDSNQPTKAAHILKVADLVNLSIEEAFDNDNPEHIRQAYATFYDHLPLNNKQILYENFHGSSVGDNPAAIMYELLKRPEYADYKHIVVLNKLDRLPKDLLNQPNVYVITRESFKYSYYLATSKYLINNSTFPWWFIRKKEQQYLNTWHGVPWKTLGRDIHTSFLEYDNTQRNFLQATHLINPNRHTTWAILERHDISNIYSGKIAEIGYPRVDVTLNMTAQRKKQIKKELGIASDKKVVFYAPTWRGVLGGQQDQTEQLQKDVQLMANMDCEFIFRGHSLTNRDDSAKILNRVTVSDKFSTNELLAITDILITDYSSVAFDFMPTGKQIIFYLYDYNQYKQDRGLYFEHDQLPGVHVFSRDELKGALIDALKNTKYKPDEKYLEAIEKFCPNKNGDSTNKVIKFFFENDSSYEINMRNKKKNILFFVGPFMGNGITTSSINLLNNIDKSKFNVHLLVDGKSIRDYADRRQNFIKLNSEIKIIARAGSIVLNSSEKQTLNRYTFKLLKPSKAESSVINNIWEREYQRIFSDGVFDYIINFEGYSRIFTQLFARTNRARYKKVIYIHNDIYSEFSKKYRYLSVIFDQYTFYDKVISVSKETYLINKGNLSKKFGIPRAMFDFVDNVQDPDFVSKSAKMSLDDKTKQKYFPNDTITFLNIGRLSVEKDHEKLILAFHKLRKNNKKIKLLILGDGPLRYQLEALIDKLNLKSSVHLLGHISNPYPYLARSHCFVLSSNYEGQPVVLYEALSLKKPVIATDIPANRGVLGGGYGLLCDNSVDGLTHAMSDFLKDGLSFKDFDIEKHNKNTINAFYNKVLS